MDYATDPNHLLGEPETTIDVMICLEDHPMTDVNG